MENVLGAKFYRVNMDTVLNEFSKLYEGVLEVAEVFEWDMPYLTELIKV